MTREQMIKIGFRPYMKLMLETHYGLIETILIAANFDNETLTLRIIDVDKFEEEDLTVSISKVSLPKRTTALKII